MTHADDSTMLEPAAKSPPDTPAAGRLVIRIKLPANAPSPAPAAAARPHFRKSTLLLAIGAVAVLLGWLAISIFKSDATAPPATSAAGPSSNSALQSELAARTQGTAAARTQPANGAAAVNSAEAEARSVEPTLQQRPDAPPSAIDEVLPDVPQSALDTIRGTVRVAIRVVIDEHGAVVDATTHDRGPSRYFARLSLEASRHWTFTRARSEDRRTMLIRFNYTRAGATARANPLE